MKRQSINWLVVASVLLTSSIVSAAETPLEAVPDSAGIVVRLKKPSQTVQQVAAFATAADPQFGPQVAQAGQGIGILISNPTLAGVDPKGDWWLAVFPFADAEPGVVFAVPAADADAMKTALPGNFTFHEYENWVLYTQNEAAAKKIEDRVAGRGKSIGTLIDKPSAAVMDRGELAVYVNAAQLKQTYKAQLDAAAQQIDDALDQLSDLNFTPPNSGVNMQPIWEMYRNIAHGILQWIRDVDGVAVSVTVQAKRIGIEKYLKVIADSPTDEYLKSAGPSEMNVLQKLPPDQLMYFAVHGNVKAFLDWGLKMATAVYEEDTEFQKRLKEVSDDLAKLDYGGYVMSFNLGDLEGGALRAAILTEVKPIDKMRDAARKMAQVLAKAPAAPIKQEVELKTEAEKYGEHAADVMTIKQEFDEEADPFGIQKQIMQALYGPDGMQTRTIYLPNLVVQTMGGGKAAMTELLKTLERPAADTPAEKRNTLAAARGQLAEKANLLVLLDLPQLAANILRLVVESGKVPIPLTADDLNELELKRSYFGLSLTSEAHALRAKADVPVEQVQGFVKLFKTFQRMQQQPQL